MALAELRGSRNFKIAIEGSLTSGEKTYTDSFEYISNNGSHWKINRLFPINAQVSHVMRPDEQDLLDVQLALSSKRSAIPEDLYNSDHSKAIQFFLQNWWRIRNIFRNTDSFDSEAAPRCYAEVDFGQLGRADFVGVCSDGSISVIEFGVSSKASQVALHGYALSQITNPETMPIYPFTAARYSANRMGGCTVNISQVNAVNISREKDPNVRLLAQNGMYHQFR